MNKPCSLSIFILHPSDLLTDHKPHGDGLVAFEFITRLAERGHTLHVVTESTDIKGELLENINLYSAETSLPKVFRNIIFSIRSRMIFNRVNKTNKIDIVHQLNPVKIGLSLPFWGVKCPLVLGPIVAFWNYKTESSLWLKVAQFFKSKVRIGLSYIQQKQADALLIATPAALNRVHISPSPDHKVYDLRHGVDADLFFAENELSSVDSSHLSILFLGRVVHDKGIFTLLDAFEIVAQEIPSCKLKIAGPWNAEIDQVKQRVSTMNFSSQIEFLGSVQRSKVPSLMNQCSVYCMPSFGEAFGMGALEAMACGKPVVGTDAGGLAYLISDKGGRKVQPGNAQALAEVLIEILKSPALQINMGQHNRKTVEEIYSWTKVIDQLESIYYELL